jgi:hypothetical protein
LVDLAVPEEERPQLNKVRTIPEGIFMAFVSALERSPSDIPSVQGMSVDEAKEIQEAVTELYRVREFFSMEVPEFVSGIADSLQEAEAFPVAELPALKERLTKLLTLKSMGIATKAASLKLEFERRFCSARILTDVRPVYGMDPSSQPDAVMIAHTLRVSYHDDSSELREVYITMDDDDLITLRELLDRAEKKTKSLRSVFETAHVPIVAS